MIRKSSLAVLSYSCEESLPEALLKILIVDDHEAVRKGVRSLLSSRAHWTVCGEAGDGVEAVEKAKSLRPDLVLMDITMPKMSGVEATRIIHREVPESEVIIISQNDPKLVGVQARDVGARSFVAKADLGSKLVPAIEQVLEPGKSAGSANAPEKRSRRLERKQSEPQNFRNLLAAIVDSSDDAIVSKNLDGYITSWNKSAERIFGYTAEEAVGKHITLIIPADRHKEEDDILARLRRGQRIDHFQTIRQRKDGTLLDVSLTISPVKDSTGRIVGASKVARDITAQKQNEQALRESEQRFRKLSESLDAEVRSRTKEVRELSWRLLRNQDEERRRIARELHDSAGQTLTVLGINLAQLAQKAEDKIPELKHDIDKVREIVQQLQQEVRTASYLLHPPLLDESGLASALNWYVQGLCERSHIDIKLDLPDNFGRLPRDIEMAIFRVVQECLTNIHRHSESDAAAIRISRTKDAVMIDVRDQGKGISREKLDQIQAGRAGVGIRGMRERLRQFEGELTIASSTSGTQIIVTIPIDQSSEEGQNGPEPFQAAVC